MNCKVCGNELTCVGTEEKHTQDVIIEIGVYSCDDCGRVFRYPTARKETFQQAEAEKEKKII